MANLKAADSSPLNSSESDENTCDEQNEEFHDPCGLLQEEPVSNQIENDCFEEAHTELYDRDSCSSHTHCESQSSAPISSVPEANSNTSFAPLTPMDPSDEVPTDSASSSDPTAKAAIPIDPMCSTDYIAKRKAEDSALELDIFDVRTLSIS